MPSAEGRWSISFIAECFDPTEGRTAVLSGWGTAIIGTQEDQTEQDRNAVNIFRLRSFDVPTIVLDGPILLCIEVWKRVL